MIKENEMEAIEKSLTERLRNAEARYTEALAALTAVRTLHKDMKIHHVNWERIDAIIKKGESQ